jgi:PAS domain S-box-containing protein
VNLSTPATEKAPGPRNLLRLLHLAVALSLLVVSAWVLILFRQGSDLLDSSRTNLALLTRSIEQRTTLIMAYASGDLQSTAVRLEAEFNETQSTEPFSKHGLAGGISSTPWIRSTSIVSSNGTVIASTNPDNLGLVADKSLWGPLPLPQEPATLGPVLAGRDLTSLKAIGEEKVRSAVLPMVRAHSLSDGSGVYLISLINLDYLTNQFDLLMEDSGTQVAMLNYAGDFITGTGDIDLQPGHSLKNLPIFQNFLPAKENATYQGIGIGQDHAQVAFRSVRDVPLVIVAQRSRGLVLAQLWPVAGLLGGATLLIVTLLAALTLISRRSARLQLQGREEIQAALMGALQSKTFHEAIQESAQDAIISTGTDRRVLSFNPAAEKMFGCPASTAVGQSVAQFLVLTDVQIIDREEEETDRLKHGATVNTGRSVAVGQRTDGTQFPVEISVTKIKVADTTYFITTVRDISELKEHEAERIDLLIDYEKLAQKLRRKNDELSRAQQHELEIGTQIQQTMLVDTLNIPSDALWLAGFNQASKGIDGDFFGIVQVSKNCFDILAGDVMGKGVPAALLGAATKLQFNRSMLALLLSSREAGNLPRPEEIVSHVNAAMTPRLQALNAFVTLVYLRIDLASNRLVWVGCGHEEPLVLCPDGVDLLLQNQHPPLGVLLDEKIEQSECDFNETDTLFLASDGASDAVTAQGQRIGRELLNACIKRQLDLHPTPSMALHTLRRNMLTEEVTLTDDVTLVLLSRHAVARDVVRLQAPVQLASLVPVRLFVAERCRAMGFNDAKSSLVIVAVVEVVTNIVRHAQGLLDDAPMELIGEISADWLIVEAKYIGDCFAPPKFIPETDFDNLHEGGFGLGIIQQVADQVQYCHDDGVNTVRLHFSGS